MVNWNPPRKSPRMCFHHWKTAQSRDGHEHICGENKDHPGPHMCLIAYCHHTK